MYIYTAQKGPYTREESDKNLRKVVPSTVLLKSNNQQNLRQQIHQSCDQKSWEAFCKFGLYNTKLPCKNSGEDWMKEEEEDDNQVGRK